MIPRKNTQQKRAKLNGEQVYWEETLMQKLRKMKDRKERPEKMGDIIYTDKKEGVKPGYNIRTDRFQIGQELAEKYGAHKATQKMNENELNEQEEPITQ